MKPGVLIAVSTYNQAEFFLPACLEYIKAHDYGDFFCVVGYDHSTDNTAHVVKKFAKDSRFLYHLTPVKYGRNSNFYNWAAKTYTDFDYFITCDGDNFLLENHTSLLMDKMLSGDYVAVYGLARNVVYADDNKTVIRQYTRGFDWDINRFVYGTSYNNWIDMSDILFKREKFIEAGGYLEDRGFQDYSIMLRLAIKFDNKIACVPEIITHYSVRESSQARTDDDSQQAHMEIL